MRHLVLTSVMLAVISASSAFGSSAELQTNGDPNQPTTTTEGTKVNLNAADQEALESLPGIGPRTAERIIAYRDEHGPFEKVEELMNVRGIGERTFLRLRELVRVGEADGGD